MKPNMPLCALQLLPGLEHREHVTSIWWYYPGGRGYLLIPESPQAHPERHNCHLGSRPTRTPCAYMSAVAKPQHDTCAGVRFVQEATQHPFSSSYWNRSLIMRLLLWWATTICSTHCALLERLSMRSLPGCDVGSLAKERKCQ